MPVDRLAQLARVFGDLLCRSAGRGRTRAGRDRPVLNPLRPAAGDDSSSKHGTKARIPLPHARGFPTTALDHTSPFEEVTAL